MAEMTRDEVLAMAREAGIDEYDNGLITTDQFAERFAALAFEAGRKAADQDRVDAERYRWLREQHEGKLPIEMDADGFPMEQDVAALAFTVFYPDPTGDESLVVVPMGDLDETIDLARSAK